MDTYKSFKTPDEVSDWVSSSYTKSELDFMNMHKHLESALSDYKGGAYRLINKCLREGYQSCPYYSIQELQDFLLKKALPESLITYRFVCLKELFSLWWNTRRGKQYEYPCFLSTTLLKDYYNMEDIKSGKISIKIYNSSGAHGTFIPEVNPYNPEFEILFAYHEKISKIGLFEFKITSD